VRYLKKITVDRPVIALCLCLFTTLGFGAGLTNLSVASDSRVFFSESNPQNRGLLDFERKFSETNNLLIAVHAKDGDLFTPERLNFIRAVTERAWKLPHTTRVDSPTNAIRLRSEGDELIIDDMVPDPAGEPMAVIRERVTTDDILTGRLISQDGRTAGININTQYPRGDSAAPGEVIAAANAMVAALDPDRLGLEVWKTGRVATSDVFSKAASGDMKSLVPISYLVITILTGFILRSYWMTFALFLTSLMVIISTLGLMGWSNLQINSATAATPTILFTLCFATLLHILTKIQRAKATSQHDQIWTGVRSNILPVALTLVTTAAGFLTLNFADSPPYRQLGTIVAGGAVFALFYGLVFMPALLRVLPWRNYRRNLLADRVIGRLPKMLVSYRRVLLFGFPVFTGLVLIGTTNIFLEDNYVEFLDHRFEFRRDTEKIETNLTGLDHIEFDFGSDTENAVLSPAYFDKLIAFETWLRAQPKVTHVVSIAETFRRLHRHLGYAGGPIPSGERAIPDDPALLAQYLLLYEMSLPFGRSLNDTITIDRSRSRVTAIMTGASTAEIRALKRAAEDWLNTHQPVALRAEGTGLAVLYAYMSSTNIRAMMVGTFVALVLVSVMLAFAFRSVRFAALSLIPNLMPLLLAFGVWGFLVGKVGITAAIVGAIMLGIIVDDTVHLMWRYLEARRAGIGAKGSVKRMFAEVGPPMLTSSIVLFVGFMLLTYSGFEINSTIGAFCALVIVFALIADWVFLPVLLMSLDHRVLAPRSKATEPLPDRGFATRPVMSERQL